MASTHLLRRAAARIIPSARGTTQRSHHHNSFTTLFSRAAPITPTAPLSQSLFRSSFSSAIQHRPTKYNSDDELLKILRSEILSEQESQDEVVDVPESFPFKIVDQPGQRTVTLIRDDHGESVTVEVHIADPYVEDEGEEDESEEDEDEEDNNDDGDDSETGTKPLQLPMVVRVSKNGGPSLEFGITGYADEIVIDSLSTKDPNVEEDVIAYEGPDFADLDENLQDAFYKYLDVRGINPRTTKFLFDYMINKDCREYLQWLKIVKKFVEA